MRMTGTAQLTQWYQQGFNYWTWTSYIWIFWSGEMIPTNTGTSATVGLILQSIIFAVAHSSWNIWNQWPSSIKFHQVPSSRTSHENLGLSSCHKVPTKILLLFHGSPLGWSLTQLIKIREGKNPGVPGDPGDPVLVNKSRKKIALNCSRCSRFRRSRKVVERVSLVMHPSFLERTQCSYLEDHPTVLVVVVSNSG